MEHLGTILFGILMVLFGIGWLGCALTIPMAAFKFLWVLFEKDEEQPPQQEFRATPQM